MAVNNVNYNDSLREGTDKINQSIDQSNQAIDKANSADTKADNAVNTANQANTKSDDTQQQLNNIVINNGESDAEVLQARGAYSVLNERLSATDEQLADNTNRIDELGFNIRWNALLATNGDWTNAIQTALDNHTHIYIPKGTFPYTSLTVNQFGTTISGNAQIYGASVLEYSGFGTGISVGSAVNYINFKNIRIKGVPSVSTDYFNTGTVGIDITLGTTSISLDNVWIDGFETLVLSNYNSFYNKITNCRLEKAKTCLKNFSNNNVIIEKTRFVRFNIAIIENGANGPLSIKNCSFEVFNGEIVKGTGSEKGLVIFESNYVEIYDSKDLPTNFPNQEATGAKIGKFGGNTLFTGVFGTLIIKNNEMQIGGAFRITTITDCDIFESSGNNIHLYSSGNNLDKMFGLPTLKSYYINDRLGITQGADGGYFRTYSPTVINTSDPYRDHYYYDCISQKEIIAAQGIHSITLENGWINPNISHGLPKAQFIDKGILLQGLIDGSAKTGNTVFTLPVSKRPLQFGTTKGFVNITCFTDYGSGIQVRFRYLYSTGVFQLEGTPANLANIPLDGIFIPIQT
jgi:hypothetical protein